MHDFLFFHTQKVLSLSLLVFGVFFNFELLYSLQFYFELIWISFVFSAVIFLILIWLQSFHCKEDMHFLLLVQNRIVNSFHHCHKSGWPQTSSLGNHCLLCIIGYSISSPASNRVQPQIFLTWYYTTILLLILPCDFLGIIF